MTNYKNNKICIGAGLVCLDILMRGYEQNVVSYKVGGTCGNVMMILSYMGWMSYPVARLNGSDYSRMMIDDMICHGVHTDFVSTQEGGATPVIIQHNIIDKDGNPTHKFEFQKNNGRFFLDYKPVTKNKAQKVLETLPFTPSVFFFDRVNPATVVMSEYFKKQKNVLVFFEPSNKPKSDSQFMKCIANSDIVKFADQRIPDVTFAEAYDDKLFIQTKGSKGLMFNLYNVGWENMPPVENPNIVDTAGAGDWTTATIIDELISVGYTTIRDLSLNDLKRILLKAQEKGSESCSYEGARGLMYTDCIYK